MKKWQNSLPRVWKNADSKKQNEMYLFKVSIEVEFHRTETASTHLCIDFGTSNTTVGCFLDEHYIDNISNLAVINGNVTLNAENVASFVEKESLTRHLCFFENDST